MVTKEGSFAQLDPKRLCEFLLKECTGRGVVLHHPAKVVSVSKDARDEFAGVRIVADDGTETDSTSHVLGDKRNANDLTSPVYPFSNNGRSLVPKCLLLALRLLPN